MSIPAEANGHASEVSKDISKISKHSPDSEKTTLANGTPESAETTKTENDHASPQERKPKPRPKRPNYAQLHSKPLPLIIHPLPAFHPSNPISLLRLSYIYLSHLFSPPSSHPDVLYTGLFSPRTRSVHITDPEHVRALWEMGFFGKGTLSRSEPSWVEREEERLRRAREGEGTSGGSAAEVATQRRREERRLFKLERARVERERIERQRAVEEGRAVAGEEDGGEGTEKETTSVDEGSISKDSEVTLTEMPNDGVGHTALHAGRVPDAELVKTPTSTTETTPSAPSTTTKSTPPTNATPMDPAAKAEAEEPELEIENQEHLQLSLEEAFFLAYGLGVLSIFPPPPSLNPAPFHPGPTPYSTTDLLFLSCHHSAFPPVDSGSGIAPDDQFLLNYVVYHHFRSLGWVVRPGVKFGCDYLLYNRGPVFSHAEFAVLIVPSYTHRYWNTPGGRSRRRVHHPNEVSGFSTFPEDNAPDTVPASPIAERKPNPFNRIPSNDDTNTGDTSSDTFSAPVGDGKDWHFLHCINRVQSQVRKSLVLVYVDIPSPWDVGLDDEWDVDVDVGRLLRGYRVREFVVRRWVVNRMRD